jgi:hypothetical protein
MNLKVLSLHMWMTRSDLRDECVATDNYEEIKPIYNRDGYYRHGDYVWFEVDGKAWRQKDIRDHVYDLEIKDAMELRPEVVRALVAITTAKIGTVKQNRMYQARLSAMQNRNIRRSARKYRLQYMKDIV